MTDKTRVVSDMMSEGFGRNELEFRGSKCLFGDDNVVFVRR